MTWECLTPQDFDTNSPNEEEDNVVYKTKLITFRGRKKRIVLQNENGPCPLIAICNVLILRDDIELEFREVGVNQERLLNLVATTLLEFNSCVYSEDDEYTKKKQENIADAISILPSLASGINVNIKFRRIDDFEFTPELAIFDLVRIPLFHGWIANPQDLETATAIGCKSYNSLMSGLVDLETKTLKSSTSQSLGVGIAEPVIEARRILSPCRSFGDAEHSRLKKGDMEEDIELLQALRISEREAFDEWECDVGALDHGQLSSNKLRDETGDVETENSSKKTTIHVTSSEVKSVEKTKLESTKSEDISGRSQGDDGECGSIRSPFYKGESLLEASFLEERNTNELTTQEGELINKFLNNNRSQLTVTGLAYLQEQVKEDELCVFFRNNHFSTMKKYNGEIYQLVTDYGYLSQRDLVWEKLNEVNGDCVFMTGDFKVFKSDKDNSIICLDQKDERNSSKFWDQKDKGKSSIWWDQKDEDKGKSNKWWDQKDEGKSSNWWDRNHAYNSTADSILSINSSKEGMEIDPDLEMAMMLQQQEFAEDINPDAFFSSF